MRTQLNPPHGFRIESIGDASGLVLNSVPQYSSMRLEEIIFQVICQVSATEPTCSERRLLSCLASIFSDMRTSPPPRQSVEAALMALIRTGTIYFCGQGYNLLTPDKLHVANWLRTLPPNTTTQGYESPLSSVKQLKSPVRQESVRCEPSRSLLTSLNTITTSAAPLATAEPDQGDTGPINFTGDLLTSRGLPRPLEKPRPTLCKTDSSPELTDLETKPKTTTENQACSPFLEKSWVGGIQNKSLTTPGAVNTLSAPTKRRLLEAETLPPNGFFHMANGEFTSGCNWRLSGGPFNGFAEHCESQEPLRREQFSRSYYPSPERHYYGRGLAEQRTNLSKSADFHILNTVKGQKTPAEEPKKRGSTALLQWFVRRIRHLRQSIKRRPQEPDWHASSTATFPIFYQNSNFIPQSAAGKAQMQLKQPGQSKTTMMQGLGRLERFCSAESPRTYLIGELESGTNRSASYCSQTCSNLRRCLSLAEHQKPSYDYISKPLAAPFSMGVIPEDPSTSNVFETSMVPPPLNLSLPLQSITPLGSSSLPYLPRSPTLQRTSSIHYQQWPKPDPANFSFLSLNVLPAPIMDSSQQSAAERLSRSASKLPTPLEGLPDTCSQPPSDDRQVVDTEVALGRAERLARSGRDSGFIDTGPPIFSQMDCSTYSISRNPCQMSSPVQMQLQQSKSPTLDRCQPGGLRGTLRKLPCPYEAADYQHILSTCSPAFLNSSGGIWWTTGYSARTNRLLDGENNRASKNLNSVTSPAKMVGEPDLVQGNQAT
ncbi:hypothetical protein AAHC03_013250 [Spirometra sp. Aus1]